MTAPANHNGTESPAISLGAWKILRWRKREGMSAEKAAALLGVSQAAVHFWETGKRVPRHGSLAQLRALGVCEPNDWHLPCPAAAAA